MLRGDFLITVSELFDLERTLAKEYLLGFEYPWQALEGIGEMILDLGIRQNSTDFPQIFDKVWIHRSCKVADSAVITGPCIIGANTEIRPGAFIRGNALVGEDCVIGNATELKNVILFDGVQAPHYNYVGDSILGYKAHLGAGAITSNVRGDKGLVFVDGMPTGRKKVGAMVGDFAEIGCGAVLNPGVVIGRRSQVYPLSCVRGVVGENCIYKNNGTIVQKE